mgnify:CR=1 FL=1
MGKIDTITKEYAGNPVVFADAFNQLLYHGNQKIDPARLTELDTTEIVIPYGASGAGVPEQKYRDVMKLLYARPPYPCGHPCNIFWIRQLGRTTIPERNVFKC